MSTATAKPKKPYPDFPLTAHPNGQWCKKIRNKLHYFGRWDEDPDGEEALNLYLDQRDDLFAGRRPRVNSGGVTLGDALGQFLMSKKLREQTGELSRRSYNDYERTCDLIAASIGKRSSLDQIVRQDLDKLRSDLATGKKGTCGPTTLKGHLTRARMVFRFINEHVAEKSIKYLEALELPSRATFRRLANERGPRMFQPSEIRHVLEAASLQLRAMIYLGINCGFGNTDCATLPFDQLDLNAGWHTYWRPKTHNPRRCPLWPETIAAMKAAIEHRPDPKTREAERLVFVTKYGNAWSDDDGDRNNPISYEFRKLVKATGFYRRGVTVFYSLRRTFETVGAETGQQVAVDHIMGHIPPPNDMASVYRQRVADKVLLAVTNHVRKWLIGSDPKSGETDLVSETVA
jgi:integrase